MSTSTKINLHYPDGKETGHTEDGFVRYVKRAFGDGKKLSLAIAENKTKDGKEISSYTVKVTEPGDLTPELFLKRLGAVAPKIRAELTVYEPISNIVSAVSLTNLRDAFTDVCNRMQIARSDLYSTADDAGKELLGFFKLEFDMDDSRVEFSGSLISDLSKWHFLDANETNVIRGKNRATLLSAIQANDTELKNALTRAKKNPNSKREMLPLIKTTQWGDLVAKSQRSYYAYTPITAADPARNIKEVTEPQYRFATITTGQDAPGRLVKLAGRSKAEYVKYAHVQGEAPCVFNRTEGEDIEEDITPTAAKKKEVIANGTTAIRTIKRTATAPLTEEEEAAAERARKMFEGTIPPKTSKARLLELAKRAGLI